MPRRVLILRPGALGDSVLTLPLVHALLHGGAARVTVLGDPASWAFLAPGQRALGIADVGSPAWLGLFGGTFKPSASAEIAAHDAAVVCLTRPDQVVAALHGAGLRDIVTADPSRTKRREHFSGVLLAPAARRWKLAKDLRPAALGDDPLLAVSDAERSEARARLGAVAGDLIVLHPGSGGDKKRWPAARFAALADRLPATGRGLVVLAGPADDTARAEFDAAWHGRGGVTFAHNWPLRLVLALLVQARAYVGNDSGITHLAARACPTVAVFGPTDPAVWGPKGPEVRVVRALDGKLAALGVDEVLRALGPFIKR